MLKRKLTVNAATILFAVALAGLSSLFCSGSGADKKVDAITSATPGAKDAVLTSSHSGWGNPDCNKCHKENHISGYTPSDCTVCHSYNNIAARPANHPENGCGAAGECHKDAHAGLNFTAPDSCQICHPYATRPQCGIQADYDVVVIGAGGGGMAAATMLAKNGLKVIVLEKNYKAGGCMTTFKRGQYSFEASLHAYDGLDEGTGMNIEMVKALGIWDKIKPIKLDPMYRVVYPDFTLDIPADPEKYKALLKKQWPDEAAGIEALFAEMKDLDRILKAVMKWQYNGGPDPSGEDIAKLMNYMSKTLTEVLDQYIHNEQLFSVFTQLSGFSGTAPNKVAALFFIAMWNSYHWGGYYYFEGGSGSLIDAMVKVLKENNGMLRANSLATKIVIKDGRAVSVQTADGACFNAKYVVSNANAQDTILKMVGEENWPTDQAAKDYLDKIKNFKIGLSAYVVYLGVDHDYRSIFGDSYEINVGDNYDVNAVFDAVIGCDKEKTAISIANYSVIDPTAAPKGKNVITITSQLGYDCYSKWNWDASHSQYKSKKEEIGRYYISRAEKILPGLSSHIEVMEVGSPVTIGQFANTQKGSIFGWDNTVDQSTRNRPEQQTPIPNLFLAGAWTFPGGGQSAVMISGSSVAGMILKAEGKNKK